MTDFQDPGAPGGDKLPLAELNGALILIYVHEAMKGVQTSFGMTDPVRCTVHAIDGRHAGSVFEDTLVFPKVLSGQLRNYVGPEPVLGRLGQGVAKAGQSAPWVLNATSDADKALARSYQERTAVLPADQAII